MKSLSAKIASIEWLIDLAIIAFVILSVVAFGLVVYGWYAFGLTAVLRNPMARTVISTLAACVSAIVMIIYTRFTYKLFVSTRASLELNREQIAEQRNYIIEQKRLQFEREDITSSTVKAKNRITGETGVLGVHMRRNSSGEKRDWRFRTYGAQENTDQSGKHSEEHAPFKILCIQHAEQFYDLEF